MATRRRNGTRATTEGSAGADTTSAAAPRKPAPRSRSSSGKTSAAPDTAASGEPRPATAPRVQVSPEERYMMVAEAAYLRAQKRDFAPGGEVEDWLAAEREIDALLSAEHAPRPQ